MSPPTRTSKTKPKPRRATDLQNVKAQLMGHFTRVAADGFEVLDTDLHKIIKAYLARIRYEIELNEDKLVAKKDGIITGRVDEEQLLQVSWIDCCVFGDYLCSILTGCILRAWLDADHRFHPRLEPLDAQVRLCEQHNHHARAAAEDDRRTAAREAGQRVKRLFFYI
jgi:hypothetical protein